MGAVCGKEERSLKQNSLQEGLELPGQQLNSGETAPGDHAGGFETAPGLLGLQNDDEMSDKDKDKGANTLMESPLAKGSIDPTYFSADELAYYEKEKRKEFGNDFLLKPQRSKIVWKQGDHIGSGSYGEVMMGLDQVTGTLMAVKKVRIEEMSGRNKSKIEALEQEISMYERLSHRNIVGYLGYEKTKNYFNIFLEYVEDNINKYGALAEGVVINYTKQILKGLEYLHSHEVIHRDLKAANVLVDRNGECKLADFGTAKSVHELNGQNNTLTGTLNWMAPEVIQQQAYGRAADIWSIGCTVYEMVNGMPPWHEAGNIVSIVQQYQVMSKVVNSEETPIFTQSVSALCKDFIACCLKRKPEDRLNVYKLLRHPFLSSKSRKDPVAMFFEADSPILPPEGDEIQSETSGLQGSDLRRAKTSRPSKLDFKQTTFRHRQAGLKQPSGKSNQQEGSKKDSKDFSLPTPCVMDSQGNQRHFFGSPYVEPNRQKRSSGSGQESFSEKIQKFNSRFGDGHDQSTLKSGTKQKPLTSRQLRIPLSKQGNITLESNNQENSRNLAINIKKKGLTLNVKTDTALGNTKIVNKGKGFHVEQPVDEVSDFDFDVHDEPEAEVIHEYKITIHEKRKLLRPLTRKPLKSQRQIATDKTSQSIYEAREADLLNNTPLREVFEVPNLVLGPVESETSRDLRSAFMPLRSPLPKTNRPTITPSDFLALSVEPGQDVNK